MDFIWWDAIKLTKQQKLNNMNQVKKKDYLNRFAQLTSVNPGSSRLCSWYTALMKLLYKNKDVTKHAPKLLDGGTLHGIGSQ